MGGCGRLGHRIGPIPEPSNGWLPAVEAKLAALRHLYEPFVNSLADYFKLDLPPFRPDGPVVDNWQTSAWMERASGIGHLSVDDDHAD